MGALLLAGMAVLLAACGPGMAPSGHGVVARPSPTGAPPPAPRIRAVSATPVTPARPTTPAGPSLAGKVVVLDAGHNGGNATHPAEVNRLVPVGNGTKKACDTTGTETNAGYQEHAFTFDVVARVTTLLRARGIKVVLTRTTDTGVGPCVNVRAAIGNDAHADAAVSVHGDGHVGGHGFQIIEATSSAGGAANNAASHRLAEALHTTFLADSGLTPATYIGDDGYEVRSDLAGLDLSTRPKVLVECGNMRDAGDAGAMTSPVGRQHIAVAIADGIIAYLQQNR